jgi:hypothetical protein
MTVALEVAPVVETNWTFMVCVELGAVILADADPYAAMGMLQ